jgi:hypothetical protein
MRVSCPVAIRSFRAKKRTAKAGTVSWIRWQIALHVLDSVGSIAPKPRTTWALQMARITCVVLIFTWLVPVGLGARISREALNTVVAIGRTLDDGSKVWVGSGFMLLHAYRPDLQGEARYRAFIVTNKHVIAELDKILVRFSPGTYGKGSGAAEILEVVLKNHEKHLWTAHPDDSVDLALIPFHPIAAVQRVGHFNMVINDPAPDPKMLGDHFVVTQKISESGTAEGEDIHVLGFPIGVLSDQLFGPERSYQWQGADPLPGSARRSTR